MDNQTDCERIAELAREKERLIMALETGRRLLDEFEERLLNLADTLTYPTKTKR